MEKEAVAEADEIDEEEFMRLKLEEVKAKAANKLVRLVPQKPKKVKEAPPPPKPVNKEEQHQSAVSYIMALIKRDSKPTNPET